MACKEGNAECPGTDYHGRCLGACRECDTHLMSTGRYTVYCPSCSCCFACGCPDADGFQHYLGCTEARSEEEPETTYH